MYYFRVTITYQVTNKYALLLLLLVASVTACKKDDPAPTKTEQISRTWKVQEVYFNGQSSTPNYTYRLALRADKTYTQTSDAIGSVSGSWDFNVDQSKVILDETTTYEIVTLSASQWKAKQTIGTDVEEATLIPS